MALDTRNKRASALGIALPVPRVWPNPDGTVGEADRLHLAYCYPIIDDTPGPAEVTLVASLVTRSGLDVTAQLEAAGSRMYWLNNGVEFLLVKNARGSAVTLTLDYQAQYNRDDPGDRTVSVGAGKTVILGPFPQVLYNNADQLASVTCSATSSVTAAVVRASS